MSTIFFTDDLRLKAFSICVRVVGRDINGTRNCLKKTVNSDSMYEFKKFVFLGRFKWS